ncbi:hypothetical protein [Streptomyces griseoloalbus]|uniref:Uncharacterized protein n=1 Tax=Streptomyces griseoloalbus TaxID=67303 RepID=A0A7W8BNA4_9ACTN|nr:hypothetical protein [Streptomyces albaduncus]MBB5125531.1 hypothetical protein [Streptomyces albaduncus]
MPIHPWGAPRDDAESQRRPAVHDFGQFAVDGPPGEPPHRPGGAGRAWK